MSKTRKAFLLVRGKDGKHTAQATTSTQLGRKGFAGYAKDYMQSLVSHAEAQVPYMPIGEVRGTASKRGIFEHITNADAVRSVYFRNGRAPVVGEA